MFTRESLIEFIEQFEPLRMRFFVWVSFQIFNVDIQRVRWVDDNVLLISDYYGRHSLDAVNGRVWKFWLKLDQGWNHAVLFTYQLTQRYFYQQQAR